MVNETNNNDANPSKRQAAMNNAEKKIQFDKDSLKESNFKKYGRISARLIKNHRMHQYFLDVRATMATLRTDGTMMCQTAIPVVERSVQRRGQTTC